MLFASVKERESVLQTADELVGVYFRAVLGGVVAALLKGLGPSIPGAKGGYIVVVVWIVVFVKC